jgi:hypothetical protein
MFLAIWWFQETIAFGFIWYALTGPISVIKKRLHAREEFA